MRLVDAETAGIKRMYVRPAARGRGAGSELMRALEAAVLELGCGIAPDAQPDAVAF